MGRLKIMTSNDLNMTQRHPGNAAPNRLWKSSAVSNRNRDQPKWLLPLRKAGIASFAELGFPTLHDEDWRFTNVAPLAKLPFKPAAESPSTARKAGAGRIRFRQAARSTGSFS